MRYHRLSATLLLTAAIVAALFAATPAMANTCRDTARCCRTFDFQAPGTNNAAPFGTQLVAIQPGADNPWYVNGLNITVREAPSSGATPYPLGLFDSSAMPAVATTGAAELHTASDGLVLSAFQYYSSALLHNTQTLHVGLVRQPACIGLVAVKRSVSFDHRQSARVAVVQNGVDVATHSWAWQLGETAKTDTFEFSTANVNELRVEFWGQGYGALVSLEVCYHDPEGYDACGICGGDSTDCSRPGDPCHTGLSGVCASGTYNAQLQCIANLANTPEQCNGIDDNCDGIIDNGDFGNWTCGVGACLRTVPRCQNGALVDSNACVPGTPSTEVCNGVDDDCNGIIDDGNACASPSPSAAPTPSTTPSASAAPAAPLLLPHLDCVRPLADGTYEAHFGYWLTGPGATPLTLAAGTAANQLRLNGEPLLGQTTQFQPGAPVQGAFAVTFGAADSLDWTLQPQGQQSQTTLVSATSTPVCGSDAPLTLECVEPMLHGCVTMLGTQCTATLGYNNPNPQTVELPIGVGVNWFSPEPADRRQPQVFAGKQLVQAAHVVQFDCSQPSWVLNWTLAVGTQSRSAVARAANLC